MSILTVVLLAIGSVIAFILIVAIFMKREHHVKRDIIIDAPVQKVFDFIKLLRNQEKFNKHAMADADRKKEFTGTDGTVGFIYAWSGNKDAGEGQKEIKKLVDGKRIETEFRFVKPMAVTAWVVMETEPLSDNQTRVSWSNTSALKYPLNIMVPMVEKMIARDMDSSLLALKQILEQQ